MVKIGGSRYQTNNSPPNRNPLLRRNNVVLSPVAQTVVPVPAVGLVPAVARVFRNYTKKKGNKLRSKSRSKKR